MRWGERPAPNRWRAVRHRHPVLRTADGARGRAILGRSVAPGCVADRLRPTIGGTAGSRLGGVWEFGGDLGRPRVVPGSGPERGGSASGRRTVNAAPCPSSLATATAPLWASTSEATMARPRPVPPVLRVRPGSARQKRSKILPCASRGMPGPSSATSNSASLPTLWTATRTGVPARVWVRALARRLSTTWRSRTGSPRTTAAPSSSRTRGGSGSTAAKSAAASRARATRSTGSRSSTGWRSSRASSSKSSTSRPIRPASASIRPMARATASRVGRAPWR